MCAGFRPSTYRGLIRSYGADPEVSKLPSHACDMTAAQVAVAYEAYIDDTLRNAGGHSALYKAVGPATGDAIVDALFHMGGPAGSRVIVGAIRETVTNATKAAIKNNSREAGNEASKEISSQAAFEIDVGELRENQINRTTVRALEELVKKGHNDAFRANLIKLHVQEFEKHDGERARIKHFAELWPEGVF